MVPSVGSVVLLENGKIGVVHGYLYGSMQKFIETKEYKDFPDIIGIDGIDFDGHYWKSKNTNLKILAFSLEEYNNQKGLFHHPV